MDLATCQPKRDSTLKDRDLHKLRFLDKPTYAYAFQIKYEKSFLILPIFNGVVGISGRLMIILDC